MLLQVGFRQTRSAARYDTDSLGKERLFSPRSLRVLGLPGRQRHAPTGQRRTPARLPGQWGPCPGPSFPLPAPLRFANISCPRPHPHPHPELPSWRELGSKPGQRSQLPQLDSPGHGLGKGTPVWLGGSHRGNPAPGAMGSRLGSPRLGQGGDNWRGARGPVPFPVVTCSLAGVSWGGRPLPALSPHAVAHAGSSAGPHAPEAAGWSTAPRSGPGRRRPRSTALAASHRALLDLPPGARCAPTPASPQTLRRGERGRWPTP